MANRLSNPGSQHYDQQGQPLSGGQMFFYVPGTSTLKNTYTTIAADIPNTNPVILLAGGLEPNIFLDGAYRVILFDRNGVQQWDRDNVNANPDVPFSDWIPTVSYGIGGVNIVYASDGNYYVSIETPNIGNDPVTSPLFWEPFGDSIPTGTVPPGQIAIGDDPIGLTGINTTVKGTLPVGDGTTTTTLAVGINNFVLTADSAQPEGIKWASIGSLQPATFEEFTTSDTWDKPSSARMIYVECIGAGASGASINAGNASGGGGGLYADGFFLDADISSSVAITVGAGGASVSNGNDGNDGGDSSFGAYLMAPGGEKGYQNAGAGVRGGLAGKILGNSGTSVTGSAQAGDYAGGAGGPALNAAALAGGNAVKGGAGGGSASNASGTSAAGGTSDQAGDGGAGSDIANGTAGSAPGGAGGGTSFNTGTSGAGAAGRVRVWTW